MTSQQPEGQQSEGQGEPQGIAGQTDDGRVFIVTPDAMAVEGPPLEGETETGDERGGGQRSVTDLVEQPDKVMRIGNMIRQLLEEVKAAPLDDASRQRLRTIHAASIAELKEGLAPELVEELDRIALPFLLGAIYADKNRQEALVRASGLDWTIVRPVPLTDGPRTGDYRVLTDLTGVTAKGRVSRADCADGLLRALTEGAWMRQAVLIAPAG